MHLALFVKHCIVYLHWRIPEASKYASTASVTSLMPICCRFHEGWDLDVAFQDLLDFWRHAPGLGLSKQQRKHMYLQAVKEAAKQLLQVCCSGRICDLVPALA